MVEEREARLWKGAVAGLAAGIVASLAMDQFQRLVTSLSSSKQKGEPATQKAADQVTRMATGGPVPPAQKPMAGEAVHYALGTALGIAYGMAAERAPAATVAGGLAFGTGAALLLDETAVPAVGLGDAPWKIPASTHLYTLASHWVFGGTAELTRRLVCRMLG